MAEGPRTPSLSEVRRTHEDQLLALAGVVGVAEGTSGGAAVLQVLVTADVPVDLPTELDGYPVEVVVTGVIEAE